MPEPTPGTAPVPAQPEPGAPAPQQPPVAPTAPPAQAQPSVEELTAKLAAETKAREVAENSAKFHQSEFDKLRTRAAAVAQPEPPKADPLEPFITKLTARGMHADDARAIAEVQYEMVRPLQDQLQRANSAMQGVSQVDQVLEAAIQANPKLFADHRVIAHTRNELIAAAQSGNLNFVNPEYAVVAGKMGWANTFSPWEGNQQPAAVQPPQGPRPLNFAGPQPGYTPAAPPGKAPNPMADALAKQMADYTGHSLNQPAQ